MRLFSAPGFVAGVIGMCAISGCVYPYTYYAPDEPTVRDHKQGDLLFVHRPEADFDVHVVRDKKLFSLFLRVSSAKADLFINSADIRISSEGSEREWRPINVSVNKKNEEFLGENHVLMPGATMQVDFPGEVSEYKVLKLNLNLPAYGVDEVIFREVTKPRVLSIN